MKIYLDDMRAAPIGWVQVGTVEGVKELMRNNVVTHMSLDHDLGYSYMCDVCERLEEEGDDSGCDCSCHTDPKMPTGYDLVKWMVEQNKWPLHKPMVHSANPVGRLRMTQDIEKYWRPPHEENG